MMIWNESWIYRSSNLNASFETSPGHFRRSCVFSKFYIIVMKTKVTNIPTDIAQSNIWMNDYHSFQSNSWHPRRFLASWTFYLSSCIVLHRFIVFQMIPKFQFVTRNLVKRYIAQMQRVKQKSEGVTEDDVNEIKQANFYYNLKFRIYSNYFDFRTFLHFATNYWAFYVMLGSLQGTGTSIRRLTVSHKISSTELCYFS